MKKRKKGFKDREGIIRDPKLRGEWVESVFVARANEEGLAVSKPWGDSKSFDFVVGKPGRFVGVQVKSTTFKLGGGYSCAVKHNNQTYARGSFDFVAAYVIPEDVWYIVPAEKMENRETMIICSDSKQALYEEYREAWHLLREAAQISADGNRDQTDIEPGMIDAGEVETGKETEIDMGREMGGEDTPSAELARRPPSGVAERMQAVEKYVRNFFGKDGTRGPRG